MHDRMQDGPTLPEVVKEPGEKAYDEECAEAARRALRQFISDNRTNSSGAAELLGVNQGTISRALSGPPGQPGLKLLILLAKKAGWSMDKILGLTPAGVERDDERFKRLMKQALEEARAEPPALPETGVVKKRRKGV